MSTFVSYEPDRSVTAKGHCSLPTYTFFIMSVGAQILMSPDPIGDGFTRSWFQICFIFTPILGERIQFDALISNISCIHTFIHASPHFNVNQWVR